MISLSDVSHHATLLVHNNRKAVSLSLWKDLQENSPAHTFFDMTVLDIDTARSIASWTTTPYSERKVGLISFHTITVPAQNALLKIVEEPPLHVGFIFITSNKEALLPTLLSRLHELSASSLGGIRNGDGESDGVENFLRTNPSDRTKLPQIVALLKQEDEEGRKDRESVRSFILDLATALKEKGVAPKYILETIEIASYAGLPSSSTKALIEYLSLLLPKTK